MKQVHIRSPRVIRKGEFLPKVEVTTIVWGYEDWKAKWECAQGDDLKLNRPTVEFNLVKIAKRCKHDIELIIQEMIKHWIAMEVMFGTRQDLINKQVRDKVRDEGTLYKTNLKVILDSPSLYREYRDMAVKAMVEGNWIPPVAGSKLLRDVRSQLAASIAEKVLEESLKK